MSDPAKSAREIEDVLSSIRRLVSESNAAPARPAPARSVAAATRPDPLPDATGASKLMLTPALRVTDPDDPWAPVPVTDEAAQPADGALDDPEADWDPEDRLSDWGEIEDSAEEAVADAIAEQDAEPFYPTLGAGPADADADADVMADFEAETGDANWPDRSAGSALREFALARGHAIPDPATGPTDADPEPATPEDVAAATPDAPETIADDDEDPASQEEAQSPMTPDLSQQADDLTASDDAGAGAGAAPVFSRRIDVKRPVAPQDTVERAAEPEVAAAEEDDDGDGIEDLGEASSPFTFPETEDGLLDEETLRDIIAEVVREELQGALGQRITRNVRKMVRREIRLALAAEDLE